MSNARIQDNELVWRKAAALDWLEQQKTEIWTNYDLDGNLLWYLAHGPFEGARTLLELAEAAMREEEK